MVLRADSASDPSYRIDAGSCSPVDDQTVNERHLLMVTRPMQW